MLHVHTVSPFGKVEQPHRAPLLQPVHPAVAAKDPDAVGKPGGDRVCMKAAIGQCYQGEQSSVGVDVFTDQRRCYYPRRHAFATPAIAELQPTIPEPYGPRANHGFGPVVIREPFHSRMGALG